MSVIHSKQLSQDELVYLSPDERRKMFQQRLIFDIKERWSLVKKWLDENTIDFWHVDIRSSGISNQCYGHIMFLDKSDMDMFLLKWG